MLVTSNKISHLANIPIVRAGNAHRVLLCYSEICVAVWPRQDVVMKNPSEHTQASPHFRFLDEAQIQLLHAAALEILETIGIRVLHPDALELLQNAGARMQGENTVTIPNSLVEECIHSAPSYVAIYNRLGEPAMHLGARNIHYGMGTDLIDTVDLDTGQRRPSRLTDVQRAARVADACPEIDFIGSFALPHDVQTNTVYVESFKAELENSIKPMCYTPAAMLGASAPVTRLATARSSVFAVD